MPLVNLPMVQAGAFGYPHVGKYYAQLAPLYDADTIRANRPASESLEKQIRPKPINDNFALDDIKSASAAPVVSAVSIAPISSVLLARAIVSGHVHDSR
jgi:hypothetical protein